MCELVFNTSPVGYQEIVSDPSYTFQAVVMTYPLIGNYGVCDEDYETRVPSIGGLVVRDYNGRPSNFRYTKTLDEIMSEYGIVGISGVDTRCLARKLRNEGSQKGIITSSDVSTQEALKRLERPLPRNAVSCVSTRKKWFSRTAHAKFDVVAVDCGIKLNIVRCLNARGCNVTVVPFDTAAEEIAALSPDGVCPKRRSCSKKSAADIPFSAFVWDISLRDLLTAQRPSSSNSVIAAATTPSETLKRAGWKSQAKTTAMP